VPGIYAFNFACEQALGGGGMKSLRNDALGKGMAQILLALPVRIPVALLSLVRPVNAFQPMNTSPHVLHPDQVAPYQPANHTGTSIAALSAATLLAPGVWNC
jgi:hypothetical protein